MKLGALKFAAMAAFLGITAVATVGPGCSHKHDDGTAPAEPLPELLIRDDTPNLLLTWIDAKGTGHTEVHPADVPAVGRSMVRVVVSDREDGTRDRFYVVDMSKARADGGYLARTMTRSAWESEIARRRSGGSAPPPPQAEDTNPPKDKPRAENAHVRVIIYGASWCHPCHQAADWLKARGIPYVLKDIEADHGAEEEMQDKLANAGRRGGSIPVIDVGGQMLIGFSPGELEAALRRAPSGTAL